MTKFPPFIHASISRLPEDWRRPRGRPRQCWLRTVEADLKPLNFGLHTARQRAAGRSAWRSVVETAMLLGRARHPMMMMMTMIHTRTVVR